MARTPFRAITTLSLCFLWGAAYAQDSESYDPDPPDRAARLSYMEGDVSMQPAGEQQWAPAILNRPLTTGDKLWTERNARAEIQVGPADVRLDSDTGFSFLNVDNDVIQMRMTAGVLYVSLRSLRDNEQIEIATPNVAVSILRPGSYRVEVNDAGDSTVVKVGDGAAEVTGPSQNLVVHAQQVVTFRGTEDLVAQFSTPGARDAFDSWNLDRDEREARAAASRTAEYVSPDVTGYEDLDDNGTWSSEAEYGYVWTPRNVAVDWAPYRYGRWVWVSPWGYTWIDDARWGYAPFHYGRWAHIRHRWCWVPGPRHVRAVYAPALVGWSGSRGGHIGWFPLGPREVYVPYRRHSHRYFDRVNFANTNVDRSHVKEVYDRRGGNRPYRNHAVPGAVTTVSRETFSSAGRTSDPRARVRESVNTSGQASAVAPQIAPGRESRLGGPTRANVRLPPQSIEDRQVVVRRAPPPASAGFARRPVEHREVARMPDRTTRPPLRGQVQDAGTPARAVVRERTDRPPRVERPSGESAPPARNPAPEQGSAPSQSSVFDRHALSERVREDRDRQVREGNQQRTETQERERNPRQMDALRQAAERQAEQRERSVQRERNVERPRMEQPRVEQPRVERPRVEQPRMEQPRAEQPRSEQPRVEQPRRPEVQNPTESRSEPQRRQSNDPRARRD